MFTSFPWQSQWLNQSKWPISNVKQLAGQSHFISRLCLLRADSWPSSQQKLDVGKFSNDVLIINFILSDNGKFGDQTQLFLDNLEKNWMKN